MLGPTDAGVFAPNACLKLPGEDRVLGWCMQDVAICNCGVLMVAIIKFKIQLFSFQAMKVAAARLSSNLLVASNAIVQSIYMDKRSSNKHVGTVMRKCNGHQDAS